MRLGIFGVFALCMSATAVLPPVSHSEQAENAGADSWAAVEYSDPLGDIAVAIDANEFSVQEDGFTVVSGWLVPVASGAFEPFAASEGDTPAAGLWFNLSGETVTVLWSDGSTADFPNGALIDSDVVLPPRSARCRPGYSCCGNDACSTCQPPTRASARCIRDSLFERRPPPECQYGGEGSEFCASGGGKN